MLLLKSQGQNHLCFSTPCFRGNGDFFRMFPELGSEWMRCVGMPEPAGCRLGRDLARLSLGTSPTRPRVTARAPARSPSQQTRRKAGSV